VEILHKTTITIERKGEECIKNKIETLSIGTTRQIHKNNSQKDRQMKANQNQKHIYIYIYIYIIDQDRAALGNSVTSYYPCFPQYFIKQTRTLMNSLQQVQPRYSTD
jgi:hypothetical protein